MHRVEGDSFEKQWQDALDGAEIDPPEKLWAAIDGEMAKDEAIKLRKQMVWYRGIAAALLLLIISSIFIGWQLGGDNLSGDTISSSSTINNTGEQENQNDDKLDQAVFQNQEILVDAEFPEEKSQTDPTSDNTGSPVKTAGPYARSNASSENKIEKPVSGQRNLMAHSGNAFKDSQSGSERSVLNADKSTDVGKKSLNRVIGNNLSGGIIDPATGLYENDAIAELTKGISSRDAERVLSDFPLVKTDPLQSANEFYFQLVPVYDFEIKGKDRVAKNEFSSNSSWADFSLKGGIFEPNFSRQSSFSNANPVPANPLIPVNNLVEQERNFVVSNDISRGEDLTAGYSYTMSLSYGKKISRKFFLQSGLEYGIYESVSSTNRVLTDASSNRFAVTEQILNDAGLDVRNNNYGIDYENVELNNSFQFASVPMRVGYHILSSKLTVSVSSGITTGFYLGNSITDPDREIDDVNVTRSDNSVYRNVNFSAVGGVSFGYRLFDQYLFTVEPVYQRAISSFTRQTSNFSALPENFGVSAGVRILFK